MFHNHCDFRGSKESVIEVNSLTKYRIGQSLPEISLEPVSRLDLIKYAEASGDFNPIHSVDEEAIQAGLPGIIAHGMWTMGNLAKMFSDYYEESFVADYSIRFKGMVFLNDIITLKAVLSNHLENKLYFNVQAVKADGSEVVKGKVAFQLYQ